ncbi:MAG: hypothetical protein Q9164_006519, partial [Protoblastenia rupestris]
MTDFKADGILAPKASKEALFDIAVVLSSIPPAEKTATARLLCYKLSTLPLLIYLNQYTPTAQTVSLTRRTMSANATPHSAQPLTTTEDNVNPHNDRIPTPTPTSAQAPLLANPEPSPPPSPQQEQQSSQTPNPPDPSQREPVSEIDIPEQNLTQQQPKVPDNTPKFPPQVELNSTITNPEPYDPKQAIASFDWTELEERFVNRMAECRKLEEEIEEEFGGWCR